MTAKIVFTLILLIGVFKPALSIKLFEFWKFNRSPVSEKTLLITRIFSAIAIILVWVLLWELK